MKRYVLSGLPILALVAGQVLGAEPAAKYDGVYTGKRSLTKGKVSAACPAEESVSVTIQGKTLTFTNSALQHYTMPFDAGPDGSFGQTHTDVGGDVVHYHGRVVGNLIEANAQNYVENPP